MVELDEFVTRLLGDVSNADVVEFGNKKNQTGIYRDWYLDQQGARSYVSIDFNGLDGSLPLDVQFDITKSLPLSDYSIVTNFGFSEHVQDQGPFWWNAVTLTRMKGRLVCSCPAPEQRIEHGHSYWHPSEAFYEELATLHGFAIVDRWHTPELGLLNVEMLKVAETGATKIPVNLLWENPLWKDKPRPPPKTA